jgi:pentatricopeptide repeat protein
MHVRKGGNWQLAIELLSELKAAGLTPNRITCNCVIGALCAANEHNKTEQLYLEMLERGLTLSHWSAIDKGMIDFHEFTEGMAVAAMRIVLRDIVAQVTTDISGSRNSASYVQPISNDLHIITGHAMHRSREERDSSVLQPLVMNMLKQLNIECYVSPSSKGRLIVSSSSLLRYKHSAVC